MFGILLNIINLSTLKYFVCNNVQKLLGSSGHSRRHHEGEERSERRQGDREERRQVDREERRQGEREERERRHQDSDRLVTGMEGLTVTADVTSSEVVLKTK